MKRIEKMNNKQIIGYLSTLTIGIFIGGYFSFDKNTINTNNLKENNKQEIKNHSINIKKIEKIKLITKLPNFIKNDLKEFGINAENLTKKNWEDFLKSKQINNISIKEVANVLKLKPMAFTARYLPLSELQKLIDQGYDINEQNSRGNTILKDVIRYKNYVNKIKEFIEMGGDLFVNINDDYKEDALSYALSSPQVDKYHLMKYLKEEGFTFKRKHLHHLIKEKHSEYLLEYLESVPKEKLLNENKLYTIRRTIQKSKDDVVEYLLNNKIDLSNYTLNRNDLFMEAIYNKNLSKESLEKILSNDKDKDFTTSYGSKPLFKAIQQGNSNAIEVLLKNKVNIESVNSKGENIYEKLEKSNISDFKKNKIKNLIEKYSKH